jgi:hypothetical protein
VLTAAATVHEIEIETEDGLTQRRLPPVIFAAAHEMQRCWNLCVETYERLRAEARDKSKEERQEIFGRLYEEVYPRLAESWLPSSFYKFVWKKFQDAQEAFAKGIRGAPKPHFRLDKIILPHVDAAGGKPVAYLAELRSTKPYYLRKLSTDARGRTLTRGFITINEHRIHFDAVLSQPIPDDALIKHFILAAKKVNPFGWQWTLQIVYQTPPASLPAPDESRWIAVDFGWRVREDGLRVAYWLDYKGRHGECILPFKCENYEIRRRREFLAAYENAYRPICDWRDYWERQSEADRRLERVKDELRSLCANGVAPRIQELCQPRKYHFYRRPDGAEFRRNAPYTEEELAENSKYRTFEYLGEREVDGLSMMRGGSLKKLAAELGDQAPECLTRWLEASMLEFKRLRAARLRMEGYRERLYRDQWCVSWSREYDCLRMEGDLNLKALAEAEEQEYPLKLSQKYRQEMASLYQFRLWLEDAFRKRGKIVRRLEAAHTTQTCPVCGANVECGPKLMLTCECGHQWDQDFGACQNMAREDWPEVRAKRRLKRAKKEVAT